jgi:phosphopantetheinyl transferase
LYVNFDKHYLARYVIKEILANWMGSDASEVKLKESTHGPELQDLYLADKIYISISYSKTQLWIALARGIEIGLDVTEIKYFPELNDVAKVFFNWKDYVCIINSYKPELEFARCWSKMESKLKLRKKNIKEYSSLDLNDTNAFDFRADSFSDNNFFVSVAYNV